MVILHEFEYKLGYKSIDIKEFTTIQDYYNYCATTPIPSESKKSSITGDMNFTGTDTYEEALDLLKNGDKKLYKDLKDRLFKLESIDDNFMLAMAKRSYKTGVVGFQPIVPLAIKGIPQNMVFSEPNIYKERILNVVINQSYSGFNDANEMRKIAIEYVCAIQALEKEGYRCNVYISSLITFEGNLLSSFTRIKTDRHPLNLMKMAFPLCHPSNLRRLGFRVIETTKYCNPSMRRYGTPLLDNKIAKGIFKEILGIDNVIVLGLQNENFKRVTDVISYMKEQGIKGTLQ